MVVRRADAGRGGAVVEATRVRLTGAAKRGEDEVTGARCDFGPVTCRYAVAHVRGPLTTAS
jgi:hypothetical protein